MAALIAALIGAVVFFLVDRNGDTSPATGEVSQGPVSEQSPSPGEAEFPSAGAADTVELAPTTGTYSGTMSQRGTRQSDRDYPVEMTFSANGSSVEYPTLGCRGTLTPTGNSNGARVYRETITSGRCDPTGTWWVTKGSDTDLAAEYRPTGDSYVVVGQLTR